MNIDSAGFGAYEAGLGTTPALNGPGYGPGGSYIVPGFSTDADGKLIPSGTVVSPGMFDGGDDVDWADVYFGAFNLPADLRAKIIQLGQKYGTTNPDVFFQSAQSLIRASDWFKTTFPGFDAGQRAGIISSEADYRNYLNQLNQHYKQYAGRDVTGAEVAAALGEGVSPDIVGRRFEADAYLKANTNDIQYLAGAFDTGQLSGGELTAYGREQAGIDSPIGQQVARRLDQAKQRFQTIFQGRLATPGLTQGASGLSAPGLSGTRTTSDVGA